MKKIASLALFMAYSTMIGHAQDIQITAEFKEIANIRQQNNGKLSLNNEQNKPIITDIDSIFSTSNVFYHVIKNGKHGIYYISGKQCIPIEYDNIERVYEDYWCITKDKKMGLCWSNGKQLFPLAYKDIKILRKEEEKKHHDIFIIQKEKYGLYDYNGKKIYPYQYNKVVRLHNHCWILEKDSTSQDILFKGKTLVKNITMSRYESPILSYENHTFKYYYTFQKGRLWGLIDEEGQIRIKPNYEKPLKEIKNRKIEAPKCLIVCQQNHYGIINLDNQIILPAQYKSITQKVFQNILEVETTQGKQLFNLQTNRIITPFYYDKSMFDFDYLYLYKGTHVTPFNPRKDQVVLPFEYSDTKNINESDNFIAQKESRYGVVNSKNEVLVPFVYDHIKITSKPSMLIIQQGEKYGIIDTSNKLLHGMTNTPIEMHRNYLEFKDPYTNEPIKKLDYNLKEIK